MTLSEFHRCNEVAMLMDIVSVSPLPEYLLEIQYKNGEWRRFDCKPLLVMKPWNRLASPVVFERAGVAHGTVSWPGEADIAPETLYVDSVPLTHLESNGT
jgi:hypothetical protein